MNSGHEYRERIGPAEAGRTVIDHLSRRHAHSSEETWLGRIAAGQVLVDGRQAVATDTLRPGQTLTWRRPPWEEPPVPLGYAILFRDVDLLAVAKPAGLPTMPNGGFLDHTLLRLVNSRFPDAAPAHRLGRGTSGIVLFTRNADARRQVLRQWREGQVEKTYLALITGRPAKQAFTVEVPIGPVSHPRLGEVFAATPDGRPAISRVRVVGERPEGTLVEVRIPTGRPHQIRIHMAAAGHPLVGDPLFVAGGRPGPALPGETGYHLHAWRLELVHPRTGKPLALECPPPPRLRQ